jgi:hypothetical protein
VLEDRRVSGVAERLRAQRDAHARYEEYLGIRPWVIKAIGLGPSFRRHTRGGSVGSVASAICPLRHRPFDTRE